MFSPTKVWRRWHRRVNVTMKRHAVATALAASTLPPLVMARGHRIGEVRELPLVVSDGAEKITKTKQALKLLKDLGCGEELDKIMTSRKVRGGVSRLRGRKYAQRKGPIVIYAEDGGIVRAFRNIPGVETACVDRLNLLTLAPGGSFGRFVIFTEAAFKKLNAIYGTMKSGAPEKKGYHLPRAQMENADVARLINSDEVQSVLRPKLEPPKRYGVKKNPLKNAQVMAKLNPGILEKRASRKREHQKDTDEYKAVQKEAKATRASHKKVAKQSKEFYSKLMGAFDAARAKIEAEKKAAAAADDDEE
jgi:large subunit ribosomal protein L4e